MVGRGAINGIISKHDLVFNSYNTLTKPINQFNYNEYKKN